MEQDRFTKLVHLVQHLAGTADEAASSILGPLLLIGAVTGLLVARWVFRGGLSNFLLRK